MELANTAAWLDLLYSKCGSEDGVLVFVAGERNRIYSAHSIGSGDDLVTAAKDVCGKEGLSLKINLMDYDAMVCRQKRDGRSVVGSQDEVKSIVSFHLDVDAGKSDKYLSRGEALDCLDAMPHQPTLIVNSNGPNGGFHAYWCLQQPHRIVDSDDRKRIAAATVRWQNHLRDLAGGKIDSTANIDRVLRVVGSMRVNGNHVTCHKYHPDRLFSLADLSLPASQTEIDFQVQRELREYARDTLGTADLTSRPITAYINSFSITPELLLQEAGYANLGGEGKAWLRPGSETGSRSLKLADDHTGINVFSGSDPLFDCLDTRGRPGRYHSVEAMLVAIRFKKDWMAAANWCGAQLARGLFRGKTG